MSWTQVHVSGLPRTVEPSDEELESRLASALSLEADDDDDGVPIQWAGPGSTLVKRDGDGGAGGACRGYVFLTFYSAEGAAKVVERVNSGGGCSGDFFGEQPLRAELSSPNGKKKKKKKGGGGGGGHGPPDLGFRSKRAAPIRKHPVIISSDGTKTGLGNKTK